MQELRALAASRGDVDGGASSLAPASISELARLRVEVDALRTRTAQHNTERIGLAEQLAQARSQAQATSDEAEKLRERAGVHAAPHRRRKIASAVTIGAYAVSTPRAQPRSLARGS